MSKKVSIIIVGINFFADSNILAMKLNILASYNLIVYIHKLYNMKLLKYSIDVDLTS